MIKPVNAVVAYKKQRGFFGSASRATCRLLLVLGLGLVLASCSSGPGSYPPPDNGPNPLTFAYPANGQQDVPAGAQIVLNFPDSISSATAQSALTLTDAAGNSVAAQVLAPGGGIVQLVPQATLQPDTSYVVKTSRALNFGRDHFAAGVTLISFTTRHKQNAPAAGGMTVVGRSPGAEGSGSDAFAYGVFSYTDKFGNTQDLANTLHLRFSESLDPNTVVVGNSFKFTDASGKQVQGRLYIQGTKLSFEPTQALTGGTTYHVSLTDAVKSISGDKLHLNAQSSFDISAVATCTPSPDSATSSASMPTGCRREFLAILQQGNVASDAPPVSSVLSPLNNQAVNGIDISSPIVGDNTAFAMDDPARHRVTAYLGTPGGISDKDEPSNPFYAVLPIVLPAGTQFASSSLSVRLAGAVPANLDTGNLQITLLDAANSYFASNPLRTDGQPTAVLLHLDLGLAGGQKIDGVPNPTYAQANGVLNQTALDVQAVGTATAVLFPDGKSDGKQVSAFVINAVGAFPIKLANTGTAIANLNLRLVLPVDDSTLPDTTPPTLTAQSPSACLYAFGSANDVSPTPGVSGVSGTESDCGGASVINSFPVDGSPALTFSEPIDPNTLVSGLQFTTSGGTSVAFSARSEGTSVVLHPDAPLQPNTQYTITAGTQLTDLADGLASDAAGNGFMQPANALAAAQTISFTTAPYVVTPAAAPFITALTPGLPCALDPSSGNFSSGGNTAGDCLGDAPPSGTPHQIFQTFILPSNQPVQVYFTKPVTASTLVPADGCLTAGSGTPATTGSFAVEAIDASGACTGVVAGAVVIPHPGATRARSFNFVPQKPLTVGQRYWLVICGDSGSACTTTARITGIDGNVLNTDPLNGSGSGSASDAGGPDLIMPFDGTARDDRYAITLQAQPVTDTNGNGRVDAGEHPQTANKSVVNILGAPFSSYMAGDRPLVLGPFPATATTPAATTSDCSQVPTDAGPTPATCVPIRLSAGGMFDLTSIDIGLSTIIDSVTPALLDPILTSLGLPLTDTVNDLLNAVGTPLSSLPSLVKTGRIILRLQGSKDTQGNTLPYQTIYIVPKCTGSLSGEPYSPCVAASLNLSVNAPDGSGVTVTQQTLSMTLIGPLSFQQNGRMFIDLQNSGPLSLTANALGLLPLTAIINPGGIHLQLDAYPVHGN